MNIRVMQLFETIKAAKEELELIKSKCPHAHTFEGMFQWYDHSIVMSEICGDCGEALRVISPYNMSDHLKEKK